MKSKLTLAKKTLRNLNVRVGLRTGAAAPEDTSSDVSGPGTRNGGGSTANTAKSSANNSDGNPWSYASNVAVLEA